MRWLGLTLILGAGLLLPAPAHAEGFDFNGRTSSGWVDIVKKPMESASKTLAGACATLTGIIFIFILIKSLVEQRIDIADYYSLIYALILINGAANFSWIYLKLLESSGGGGGGGAGGGGAGGGGGGGNDAAGIALQFSVIAQNIGQIFYNHSREISLTILPTLLTWRLTWEGLRVMLRMTNIYAVLIEMLVASIVVFVFVVEPIPQKWIQPLMPDDTGVAKAGRQMGKAVLDLAPASAKTSKEFPFDYWADWINGKSGGNGENKFTLKYATTSMFKIGDGQKAVDEAGQLIGKEIGPKGGADGIGKMALNIVPLADLFKFMFFFMIAGAIIAGTLGAVVIMVGMMLLLGMSFIGSTFAMQLAFYLVLGLSVSVLPLGLLTKSFGGLWHGVLKTLVTLALAYGLFYVFSAVGYTVVTNIHEKLFTGPGQDGTGYVSTETIKTMTAALKSFAGIDISGGNLNVEPNSPIGRIFISIIQLSGDIIKGIISLMLALTIWATSNSIIAAEVSAGVGMGLLGLKYAFSWANGFTETAIIDPITRLFNSLQGTIMSGVGSGIGEMTGKAQQVGSATMGLGQTALNGLGGILGKMRKR